MKAEVPDGDGSVVTTKEVLHRYLAALTAGDLDVIAASFAEDATWSLHGTLPLSGTKRGRAEIMDFLVNAGPLFQQGTQQFTFGDVTAEADRARPGMARPRNGGSYREDVRQQLLRHLRHP